MKTIYYTITAIILFGCTEKISIAPVYTGDTNWTPTISMTGNNYQRVFLEFGPPPRLELERNLVQYIFEIQKVGDTNYIPIDSVNLVYRPRGFIPSSHVIQPVLEQDVDYSIRMKVQYRNDIERISNSIAFHAPIVKGKVLQRVSWSQEPNLGSSRPEGFGIGDGYIYMLYDRRLIRIHIASGETTYLVDQFVPEDEHSYHSLSVFNNLALVTEQLDRDTAHLYLKYFELDNLQFGKIIKYPVQGIFYGGRIFYFDANIIYLLLFLEGQWQVILLNAENGNTIQKYPPFSTELLSNRDQFSFDGSSIWMRKDNRDFDSFDNRIVKFDPQNSIVFEEHRNPIFRSIGLAWDGAHFWVYDYETDEFCKLKLEGL